MPILKEEQIEKGYFNWDFSYNDNMNPHINRPLSEVREWDGRDYACIACTQLIWDNDHIHYTNHEKKRILAEWADFLSTNTKALKGVHFCSSVPQVLLEAVCCQENLETLHIKWGTFSDWSCLENLKNLKYFSSDGFRAKVSDISPIGKLSELVALSLIDYKKFKDLTPLANLQNLEQLTYFADCTIKDVDFLRQMPNLRDLRLVVNLEKNYSLCELNTLMLSLTNLRDSSDFFPRLTRKIKKRDVL